MTSKKSSFTNAAPVPLPPLVGNQVHMMQLQFFDNSAQATQGRSKYALKIEAYYKPWNISLEDHDWWRVVQLMDPKRVCDWARREFTDGNLDQSQLDEYEGCEQAEEPMLAQGAQWVRMGHIGSTTSGKTYFPGQFVFAVMLPNDDLRVIIRADGRQMRCTEFKAPKVRRRAKGAALIGFYDPSDILGRQREEKRKLREKEGY